MAILSNINDLLRISNSTGRVLVNSTNAIVSNSEVLTVGGRSSLKNDSSSVAALVILNGDSTANTFQPYIYFSDVGGNRAGFGVETSTASLKINAQANMIFSTGAASLGGTEKMRIDSSGNVGIGTTSPDVSGAGSSSTVLSVIETVGNRRGILELGDNQNADTGGIGSINFVGTYQDAGHKIMAEIRASGSGATSGQRGSSISMYTKENGTANIAERMRIDSDGKIQVGSDKVIWAGGYGGGLVIRQNNATGDRLIKMVTVDSTGAIVSDNVLVAKGASVGIGTSAPLTKLDVRGSTFVSGYLAGFDTTPQGNYAYRSVSYTHLTLPTTD